MGQQGRRYRVTKLTEAADAVTGVVSGARWSIDILSPALDPALYDQAAVTDAVRDLAVNAGRRARVRLLIRDAADIARAGHRLALMGQQLTTAMAIRRLAAEDADDAVAFLIVDERAAIRWEAGGGYAALVEPDSRSMANRLVRAFVERWERAEPEPELRRLTI